MGVRFKDAIIESIKETDTKRLKLLKVSSKSDGATLTIELPEALSSRFNAKDHVDVVIDSKAIPKGEQARLYGEGTVFRRTETKGLEILGSLGGLRVVLGIAKPTSSQSKTFSSNTFYIVIT
ncbi:MAG: hypothetical protein C4K49_04470 [Candidatus Thorarchaeota archaeon]|nr:MAG: hypothetical protein C4K49_04470 [Candidatus Thorarchaeota archaeon]